MHVFLSFLSIAAFAFSLYDADRSGSLSAKEVKQVLHDVYGEGRRSNAVLKKYHFYHHHHHHQYYYYYHHHYRPHLLLPLTELLEVTFNLAYLIYPIIFNVFTHQNTIWKKYLIIHMLPVLTPWWLYP